MCSIHPFDSTPTLSNLTQGSKGQVRTIKRISADSRNLICPWFKINILIEFPALMCKQDQPLVLLVQIQDDQDRVQVEMTKSFQVHIQ